ncbi:TPA: MSHA biogenesis protein MshQ [Vibrio parahaemolyticus]|nr:MSHA biogenesis protein MshQ [Vibrio parahaemolyticus]
MKKIIILLALSLMLPNITLASQCNVLGQSDFTISFRVEADDDFQAVKLQQGQHGYYLWYTKHKRSENRSWSYLFNERSLTEGLFYDVKITHDSSTGTLRYFRKLARASSYELIDSMNVSLKSGNYLASDVGDDIGTIHCSNSEELVPPVGPINRSPTFEFGTVDRGNCRMDGNKYTCTIDFENTYDRTKSKPLVFVMPTIDASLSRKSPRVSEYPSTVSVVNTSYSTATIVQEFAPHNKADSKVSFWDKDRDVIHKEMAKVDYFIIEPGVLELNNGSKIVAGTIDTKVAASEKKSERNNGVTIDFADFGLNHFDKIPGVLVQSQTRNNDRSSDWFTALARDVTKEKAKISLETSEVYSNLRTKETLAFVAGQGAGYINGRKFWLGDGTTKYTLNTKDPVIDPVVEGCSVYTPFPDGTSFNEPPILVANKNSRRGPNGGWLKRCDVTKNSAAFIIEEDMQKDKERGHKDEDVGWFMFEKANTNPMCNGFNSPVQTWKRPDGYIPVDDKDGELHLYGSPTIVGAPLVDGKRVLGFLPDHIYDRTLACSEQTCTSDEGLMTGQEALENFPNHLGESRTVLAGDTLILDDDNQTYETLSVGGTVIIKSGHYKIGKIDVWEDGKVIIRSGNSVTIDTRSLAVNNRSHFGIEITSWANPQLPVLADAELRVNVHNIPKSGDREYVDLNGDAQFVGLLYSEKHVEMSGDAVVYGSVSARSVQLTSTAKIQAATECIDPPTSYELTLTPTKQYALTCGEDQPSFIIETKNGTQPESTGVTVGVGPNESGLSVQVADNVGSGSYPHFITSNSSSNLGKLKLSVMVTDNDKIELNKDYKLTVTLDNDSSKTLASTFRFVPYKFDVQPQFVIAGQGSQIETKVLACQNDSQTVVKSYQGTPIVEWDIATPETGRKEESLFTYAPTFSDGSKGVTSGPFKVMESGVYTVTLTDTKFTCDPNYSSDCPIAPKGDDSSQSLETVLTGSFTVQSRPWKIAACDIVAKNGGKLNPGTQGTDSGFIPSGEGFNVTYKPVVHRDSKGQASDLCDYPVTQNFFSDDSLSGEGAKAQFDTEFSIAYPSSTDSDIANLGDKQQLEFNKDNAKSGLTVEYAWNEVGSLDLKTSGTYFQKSLTDNHVTIGRFYPKYFQVTGSNWTYPDAQSFAYMGQPFDGVSYSVEALNSNEDSLKNYALFESANQAMFNIDELDTLGGRFDAPSSEGSWGLSDKTKSLGSFTIGGNSLCGADSSNRSIGSACFIKDFTKINDAKGYADGPYNQGADATKIGLVFAGNSQDPVSFLNVDKANDSRLIIQPKIRFGRVNLSDAGEKQGTDTVIHIPLRIECWDGERFTPNLDDSQTRILGVKSKQAHIWPVGDDAIQANVELSAGGEVISGRSRSIEATEEKSNRQQTKVWLDLESGGNSLPWLKYNWDKTISGEENPSSVVTFGIHRGNDRVIYRGEPGLTGQ